MGNKSAKQKPVNTPTEEEARHIHSKLKEPKRGNVGKFLSDYLLIERESHMATPMY